MDALAVTDAFATVAGAIGWDGEGYVDCQALATACGTTMQAYENNNKNARFLHCLAVKLGLQGEELIRPGTRGGHHLKPRTCHPEVAVDFARWAVPELAVELSGVLFQYLTGGLLTVHSIAAREVRYGTDQGGNCPLTI